jgi:hypothetical protein
MISEYRMSGFGLAHAPRDLQNILLFGGAINKIANKNCLACLVSERAVDLRIALA